MQGFRPLTNILYSVNKYLVVPVIFYQVISRCESFEDQAIVYLEGLIIKQIKKELSQPHVIQAGYSGLQSAMMRNLYCSHNNTLSVSNFISRLMQRQEVKDFAFATADSLLNKPWLKKLLLDTIDSYKNHFKIESYCPDSLDP